MTSFAPQFADELRSSGDRQRGGRRRRLFPNYLFFQVPREFPRWDLIRWGPGVKQILEMDGDPAVVEDAVVARLRQRASWETMPASHGFTVGQPVLIDRGPLRMVDAIFDRQLDRFARVQVLIQLLGRQVPIALDSTLLRAAG